MIDADKSNKENVDYLKNNHIDVDHGLELLGDMDMYNETINIFFDGLKDRIAKIKEYKTSNDMPNYAIGQQLGSALEHHIRIKNFIFTNFQ